MTATLTAPTATEPRTGAPDRAELLDALRTFVCQRPGVNAGDYGEGREGWLAYRRELAEITKDRQDALTMLDAIEWRQSITAEEILRHLDGRLHWEPVYREIDYHTGQYFATEYRPAVCRFVASVLWAYWRDECGYDTREKIQTVVRRTFRSRRIWQYFN